LGGTGASLAAQGFYAVGLRGGYIGLTSDLADEYDNGAGAGLRLGYWLDEDVALELDYLQGDFDAEGSDEGELKLDAFEACARYSPLSEELVQPYAAFGAGFYAYDTDPSAPGGDATCFGVLVGIGADLVYPLSQRADLGVGLEARYNLVFQNKEAGVDMGSDIYQVLLQVGLNFR